MSELNTTPETTAAAATLRYAVLMPFKRGHAVVKGPTVELTEADAAGYLQAGVIGVGQAIEAAETAATEPATGKASSKAKN